LALRARIVLACTEGMNSKEVATFVGVTESTVGK
jgi:transposase